MAVQRAVGVVMPQHRTEAARIFHAQHLRAVRAGNHQVEVVVLFRFDAGRHHPQMAGHAQVDDQGAVLEMHEQVFAAPAGAQYGAAGQQLLELLGKRPAQAGAAQHHVLHGAAFEMGRDAAPGDFHFW